VAVSSRVARLRLTALAAAAVALVAWAFLRTPVQPLEGRAQAAIEGARLLLALAAVALAFAAALSWTAPRWFDVWARRAGILPGWLPAVLVAMAGSYLAGRIAITSTPEAEADYWPALVLWCASMALVVVATAPVEWFDLARYRPRASWITRARALDLAIVLGLTAAAAALRIPGLDSLPPLVHGDEEAIGLDGLRAVDGELRNLFGAGWGTNPAMGFLYYGAFLKVFGIQIESVRLGSAVWGVIAVPMLYLLLREMFGRGIALTGAIFLVGYHMHLHFSRVGVNVIWDTPVMIAALFFAYRASRDGRAFDFALAGLIAGGAQYLYHGTRVVPIVLLVYFASVYLFRWRLLRDNVANLALFGAAFAVAAGPGGMYSISHEHVLTARLDETGLFQSGYWDQQRDLGRSPSDILLDQVEHAFGGWIHYPDESAFRFYSPSKPLVQGVAGLLLLAGIAYAVLHIDDRRHALLLIAFAVPTLIGGALTTDPPNAQRMFGALPAVIALIAVGMWQIAAHLLAWRRLRPLVPLVVLPAAVWLAVADARVYIDGADDSPIWGGPIQRVSAAYIRSLPPDTRVYWYGAPLVTSQYGPISLHARRLIEVFEVYSQDLPPVEAPSSSVYMFLEGRVARLPDVQEACPGGTVRTLDYRGQPWVTVYELDEPNTCQLLPRPPDHLDDAVVLDGPRMTDYTDTFTATLDPGEPQPCVPVANTVWYTYTAQAPPAISADTSHSAVPTVLAAYRRAPDGTLTMLACHTGAVGTGARIRFEPVVGETVYFQISHPADFAASRGQHLRFNLSQPGG
jgi:4-amino-4-deoxy-L-arabinose transferase-like glycosyltransferase